MDLAEPLFATFPHVLLQKSIYCYSLNVTQSLELCINRVWERCHVQCLANEEDPLEAIMCLHLKPLSKTQVY
jgi:hypothetical protein